MKILVIGRHGQLGQSINKVITNTKQDNEYIFAGREEFDLSKEIDINSYFNKIFYFCSPKCHFWATKIKHCD